MIDSIIRNQNLGFKNIKLFEIGSVYDENRTEYKNIAFVASGLEANESYPSPKGEKLDFYSFARKLAKIIGSFKLVPLESNRKSCKYNVGIPLIAPTKSISQSKPCLITR